MTLSYSLIYLFTYLLFIYMFIHLLVYVFIYLCNLANPLLQVLIHNKYSLYTHISTEHNGLQRKSVTELLGLF